MAQQPAVLVQFSFQLQQEGEGHIPFIAVAPHLQLEHLQAAAETARDGALVAAQRPCGLLAGATPEDEVERGQLLNTHHDQHNQRTICIVNEPNTLLST